MLVVKYIARIVRYVPNNLHISLIYAKLVNNCYITKKFTQIHCLGVLIISAKTLLTLPAPRFWTSLFCTSRLSQTIKQHTEFLLTKSVLDNINQLL